MDSKEIRELIEIISRSNFSSFELEREGFKLRLVKGASAAPPPSPAPEPSVEAVLPESASGGAPAEAPAEAEAQDGLIEMTSPIVGTFYRAASPGASPFVEVGVKVSKGQVLCIVEAMKLMNEIESEIDAEIAEIPVANGQPVEYGEVLFRLRPL